MRFPRSSFTPDRSRIAGVTLIEVMLFISVGAVVVAMMGAVYVIVQGTFSVQSRKVTAQQEANVLSDYIDRKVRDGASILVYRVPDSTVPADSGDGLAVFDADGLPLARIEYDDGVQTVVDSTGAPVTALTVRNLAFVVDPLAPERVGYRFAATDGVGNQVDIESAVSVRN